MTGRAVRVDGVAGAPVLVLVNALGATTDMWQPQMPLLADRFRVVRYEHRGHGRAAAPPGPYSIDDLGGDLLAVLEDVGADRASVMGLSLGATAALWLAARHPERVERLVLACGSAHWPVPDPWCRPTGQATAGGPVERLEDLLGVWFTPELAGRRPELAALARSMLEQASPEGYDGACAALAGADLRPALGSVTAPTLVLGGASDPVIPMAAAAGLAEAIPGAVLTVLPGAHLVNLEQPERFTRAALDHLAGTAVERGRATRRQVLGDHHVDRSEGAETALTAPFSDLITRYAWGEIWTRPGLDRPTRSCITLAMLVALGRFDELELHLLGARRNGLSDAQIGEVLLQAAVYCGVPAANSAFAVARRILARTGDD